MITKSLLFLLIFFTSLFAKEFSVATYNVENFFDLNYDKTEYKEYIPNTNSNWNKTTFDTKLNNILKVLNDLDKDIIALQEVESNEAFSYLVKNLPKYKYHTFKKYKNSSIGLGLLSIYKIKDVQLIHVKHSKVNRPILKITIIIDNEELIIYNNHWPSKRSGENQRILYAQALENDIKTLDSKSDYIILGDLNSNYNEFETFKYLKLNNTYNLTGINDILKTTQNGEFIKKSEILNKNNQSHYNLWLELNYNDRFSYKFRDKKETPDNIIIPQSMFDNQNINYVNSSFDVFKTKYLIENGKINRWQIVKGKHKNRGFSDHLPIYAVFSTTKKIKPIKKTINHIDELYNYNDIKLPLEINNIILLYKTKEIAIVKELNNKAILIYKNIEDLKFNKIYTLKINHIKNFNGLFEITQFTIIDKKTNNIDKTQLFLDASKYDILDVKNQNEVITNLKGEIKNNYFHYIFKNEKKKIKLYSKNRELLPKNGQKINIINAHLGFYKSKPQIIIYKQSDFKYVD